MGVTDHSGCGFAHSFDEKRKKLLGDERQQQSYDNLWKAMLYKTEQVKVPPAF
jgi:hypothetical protein